VHAALRRVSTTLRQVLTEFSEFFHVSRTGLLIQTSLGRAGGLGALRTKRSGLSSPFLSDVHLISLRALIVALVVFFPELAVRLQPGLQITIHVATVTATFAVNLKRSLTDFVESWHVFAFLFWNLRPMNASQKVLRIPGWVL
jgi:hypothetical protein